MLDPGRPRASTCIRWLFALLTCLAVACAGPAAPPELPAPPPERLPLRVVPEGWVDHSHDDEADGSPAFPRDALPSDFRLRESGYDVEVDELRPIAGAPGTWELVRLDPAARTSRGGVPVPRARVEDLYLLATELSAAFVPCDEGRRDAMVMRAAGIEGPADHCEDDPRAADLPTRFGALAAELRTAPAR